MGTRIARQQHFFRFLQITTGGEDMTLNRYDLTAVNQLMMLYAGTLMMGETLDGNLIRLSTIDGYLRAANDYLRDVGLRRDLATHDPETGEYAACVEGLRREQKKWEEDPKRVSPVTIKIS
jgi:hypothetical protein